MDVLEELMKLIKPSTSPATDGQSFIHLICSCDFEPHGVASETWELIWTLMLPQTPYHWKSTKGWQRGTTDKPMSFTGRTHREVIAKAIGFLQELKES